MTTVRTESRSRPVVALVFALVVGLLFNLATLARLPAQRPGTDSTNPRPLVGVKEVTGGAVLLAGAFLLDGSVRSELQADRSPASNRLARVGNAFGNGLYVLPPIAAAYLVGRLVHQPRVTRAALRAGAAFVLSGAATGILKLAAGRARPFQRGDPGIYRPFSGFDSFPSGHVTVAVATAVTLAAETDRRWLKVLLYGGAGLTGYARMNDDKHWLSDVVAGAAVGIVAGRLVSRWRKPARLIVTPGGLGLRFAL